MSMILWGLELVQWWLVLSNNSDVFVACLVVAFGWYFGVGSVLASVV